MNAHARYLRALLITSLGVCSTLTPLAAQTNKTETLANAAAASSRPQLQDGLNLAEFIAALRNNNGGLRVGRNEAAMATSRVKGEQAIFEPSMTIAGSLLRSLTPRTLDDQSTTSFNGSADPSPYSKKTQQLEASVKRLLQDGTELSITLRSARSQVGSLLDYQTTSFTGLTLKRPLLRGAGQDLVMADIQRAELGQAIAQVSTQEDDNSTTAQASVLFLDGLRAQHMSDNIAQRVDVLEKLLNLSERLITEGRLPGSARREIENALDQIRAVQAQTQQQLTRFKTDVLTVAGLSAEENPTFRFDASLLPQNALTPCPVHECIRSALTKRADYQAQLLRERQSTIDVRVAQDQTRSRVDLSVELGVTEQAQASKFPGSWSLDGLRQHPSARIGLDIELPLGGNQKGAAALTQAELSRENNAIQSQALRLQIENEIHFQRQALATTATQWQRWQQVAQRHQAQAQLEQTRLEQGRGDVLQVLRAQEQALDARATVEEARVEHAKAWVRLMAALGSLQEGLALNTLFRG
jgi:outer membrane protein TolC